MFSGNVLCFSRSHRGWVASPGQRGSLAVVDCGVAEKKPIEVAGLREKGAEMAAGGSEATWQMLAGRA